jgi:hypothetical protein
MTDNIDNIFGSKTPEKACKEKGVRCSVHCYFYDEEAMVKNARSMKQYEICKLKQKKGEGK